MKTQHKLIATMIGLSLTNMTVSLGAETLMPVVKYAGKQMDVHKGQDLSAHITLSEISPRNHLYAVGPLEQLKGEVTVIDGKILVSGYDKKTLSVQEAPDAKAAFLVYANVPHWQQVKLPGTLDMSALETAAAEQARKAGLPSERPFPFLATGKAIRAGAHVVNKDPSVSLSPDMEKERIHFDLSNQDVQLVGFYSTGHKGIFTHHDRNSHMHVMTMDNKSAGHLETIELTNATLFLPSSK